MGYALPYDLIKEIEETVGKEKAEVVIKVIEGGLSAVEEKAREQKAVVKAEIKDELTKELVTKAELRETEERLRKEITGLRGEMKALEERLNGRINKVEERLNGRINKVEERLNGRINEVNGRIDKLEERLNGRIDRLNLKLNLLIVLILLLLTLFNPTVTEIIKNFLK